MENIEMPAGLFDSLRQFVLGLPAAAFGNTPAAAVGDLVHKLGECKVVAGNQGAAEVGSRAP